MDKIKLAQRTISLLNSMIESGECHTTRTREMKDNALNGLEQLRIADVSGSASDFYKDLMKLINAYCAKGLKKPDLVSKMKYATESCKMS